MKKINILHVVFAVLFTGSCGMQVTGTGSMRFYRSYHRATLLQDGRVLMTGGAGTSALAEIYDPDTGTFTLTGAMNKVRTFHTATVLKDGKVLIAGGVRDPWDNPILHQTAEIYDPVTGIFTLTGSLSQPCMNHTATLLKDGRVLITGCSPNAEIYDPATGLFTPTGSIIRFYTTALLLPSGRVLLSASFGIGFYNPDTDVFVQRNVILGDNVSLLPDGELLFFNGSEANRYNIKTNEITYAGSTHRTFEDSYAPLGDGNALFMGYQVGTKFFSGTVAPYMCFSVFRLATGNSSLKRLPEEFLVRGWGYSVTVLLDGRVLVAGGELITFYGYDSVVPYSLGFTNTAFLIEIN